MRSRLSLALSSLLGTSSLLEMWLLPCLVSACRCRSRFGSPRRRSSRSPTRPSPSLPIAASSSSAPAAGTSSGWALVGCCTRIHSCSQCSTSMLASGRSRPTRGHTSGRSRSVSRSSRCPASRAIEARSRIRTGRFTRALEAPLSRNERLRSRAVLLASPPTAAASSSATKSKTGRCSSPSRYRTLRTTAAVALLSLGSALALHVARSL